MRLATIQKGESNVPEPGAEAPAGKKKTNKSKGPGLLSAGQGSVTHTSSAISFISNFESGIIRFLKKD